jgi:hypothetical protein
MNVEIIEELLKGVEKKVHAGEWIRINDVRILLNTAMIMAIEDFQQTLNDLKNNLFGEEE